MALTQDLSTQIGAACAGAFAFAAAPVAVASIAPVALPLTALAAMVLHRKDECGKKARENAQKAALKDQAQRTDGPASTTLSSEAASAFRKALNVRPKAEHPVDWAISKYNLAHLVMARAKHPTCQNPRPPLKVALAFVNEALSVFDPFHMAPNHAKASRLREQHLKTLVTDD